MLHVNTKDNENGRRRRDRPLGLSLQRGVRGNFRMDKSYSVSTAIKIGDSAYLQSSSIVILIFFSTLLILLFPVSSFARPLNSLELIGKAYSSGKIDYRDALNYRVRAVLSPETLPAVYRSKSPVKSGTPILIEARRNKHLLTPENRRLLARDNNNIITKDDGEKVTLSKSYVSTDKHFRIHYTTDANLIDAVPTTDNDDDGIPDYVEKLSGILDYVWDIEINSMGYDAPPSDGDLGWDCLLDVYLVDLGAYGYTYIDGNQPASTVYMVLDNDFSGFPENLNPGGSQEGSMKVAAAHEFFHTVQFQITEDILVNEWWMEASATWIEDYVYPEVDDYVNYIDGWFNLPEFPLNYFPSDNCSGDPCLFPYGTSVWVKHMTEKYGTGFVYDIWDRIKNSESALSAIENELTERGVNLADEIKELRVANLTFTYDDGDVYQTWDYTNPITVKYTPYTFTLPETVTAAETLDTLDTLDTLAAKYYSLNAPAGQGSLDISFTGDGNTSVIVVGDRSTNTTAGYDVTEVLPDTLNYGSVSIKGFSSDGPYKRVVVILINHSTLSSSSINLSASYTANIPDSANSIDVRPADSSITVEDAGYGKMGKQQYFIILRNADKQVLENGVTWASNSSSVSLDTNGFAIISDAAAGTRVTASLNSLSADATISGDNQAIMAPGTDRDCSPANIVDDVTIIVNKDTSGSSNKSDNRCFIATATFGSPLHPYVKILREFRDHYLLTNLIGRNFVILYYNYSPPIARTISKNVILKGMVKIFLIPAIILAGFMLKTTLMGKLIIMTLVVISCVIFTRKSPLYLCHKAVGTDLKVCPYTRFPSPPRGEGRGEGGFSWYRGFYGT